MTSRLEVVPQSDYTPEDAAIWLHVCPSIRHLLIWARYSDQRDADVMYRREEDRLSVYPSHRNPIERLETAMAIYKFSGPFR